MLRFARYLVVCLVLVPLSISQVITVDSRILENTSACSFAGDHGCYAAFDQKSSMDIAGFALIPNGGGARYRAMTQLFNMAPMNVSGPAEGNQHAMDIRQLFPGAPDTRIMVHFMPWFYEGSDNHLRIGYASNNGSVIDRQLSDIKARGFGGILVDWNGDQSRCRTSGPTAENLDASFTFGSLCSFRRRQEDEATQAVRGVAAAKGLEFAFVFDQGAYSTSETCFAEFYFTERKQVLCIQGKVEADFAAAAAHFGESNYVKHNGRPVIFAFVKEDIEFEFSSGKKQIFSNCVEIACELPRGLGQCDSPKTCWNRIWREAIAQTPGNPVMAFKDSHTFESTETQYLHHNGIRHVTSDGMYGWVQPNVTGRPDITRTTQSDFGDTYLRNFYDEATCTIGGACSINTSNSENTNQAGQLRNPAGMLTVGSVYKGFDNYLRFTAGIYNETTETYQTTVPPGDHNVMSQRCGATWLDSWERINKGDANTIGQSINIVQVATWNDYDEGTAIEPGIESCFTISGIAVNGILYWNLYTPGDVNGPSGAVQNGAIRTVDHFEIFFEDGEDVSGSDIHLVADQVGSSYYTSSVSDGNRCVDCRHYNYFFQYDVSSLLASYPNRLLRFYVKAIGKPGIVNKMTGSIPSDMTLSLTRPQRPPRNASSSNEAFMQDFPPVPPEDQYQPPPPPPPPPPPDPNSCTNPDPNLPPMECPPPGE